MIKQVGRYQVLEKIGQGGMGTVYKAFDPLLERAVAVKVIAAQLEGNPHLRERFFREARAAGHLSHRNIIVIHDLGEQDGQPYLAMEYLEGTNLDARIRSVGRLRLERALHVTAEVCEGLEYAHARGVFHRDIKPANIFLTDSGQIKVLDFGLARLVSSELTRSNTILGTVNYMAPEQIRGEKVDHRGDVFSVGVVLYELLTGKKAFDGDSFATTIFKILQEIPEPPQRTDPTIPSAVSDIVDRAIAKARDERYQTIGEMLRDLTLCREALKGSDPTMAVPVGVGARPPSDPGRRADSPIPVVAGPSTPAPEPGVSPSVLSRADSAARRTFAALLVGAVILAGLAYWFSRRESPAPVVAEQPQAPTGAPPVPAAAPQPPGAAPTDALPGPPGAAAEVPTSQGTTARDRRSPPGSTSRPAARAERAAPADSRIPRGAQQSPPPPAPAVPPPAPAAIPDRQHADDALAQMTRAKGAADAVGAESLASNLYAAAAAAERDGRERHSQTQYGQAAAKFYEAAGLFRSAETAARAERAARDEQARRADEAAKAQARQSEARPAPPPRAAEPAGPPPEQLVRDVIARYERALEARSIEDLKTLWPTMTAAQQRAIRSDFDNSRSIRVDVTSPHIELGVGGDTARVSMLRRYELVTTDGRRLQTDTKTTIVLRRSGGAWHIEDVQHQTAR